MCIRLLSTDVGSGKSFVLMVHLPCAGQVLKHLPSGLEPAIQQAQLLRLVQAVLSKIPPRRQRPQHACGAAGGVAVEAAKAKDNVHDGPNTPQSVLRVASIASSDADVPPSSDGASSRHSSHDGSVQMLEGSPHTFGQRTSDSGKHAAAAIAGGAGACATALQDDNDDVGVLQLEPDIRGDLNAVTEVELRLAKAAMDAGFLANQLKPGDPGYVWDKEVEFGDAMAPNEWDSDEESVGENGNEGSSGGHSAAHGRSASEPQLASANMQQSTSKGCDAASEASLVSVPDEDISFGEGGSDLELELPGF
eukprot:366278-Chlamydomonas_euryale.AAC.27